MNNTVIRRSSLVVLFSIFFQQGYAQLAKHTPSFNFENASLVTILEKVSKTWRVEICNPKKLKGVNITAGFPKNMPLKTVVYALSHVEEPDHVYLRLQNGVIFVGDKPFPESFVPSKKDWPCL